MPQWAVLNNDYFQDRPPKIMLMSSSPQPTQGCRVNTRPSGLREAFRSWHWSPVRTCLPAKTTESQLPPKPIDFPFVFFFSMDIAIHWWSDHPFVSLYFLPPSSVSPIILSPNQRPWPGHLNSPRSLFSIILRWPYQEAVSLSGLVGRQIQRYARYLEKVHRFALRFLSTCSHNARYREGRISSLPLHALAVRRGDLALLGTTNEKKLNEVILIESICATLFIALHRCTIRPKY